MLCEKLLTKHCELPHGEVCHRCCANTSTTKKCHRCYAIYELKNSMVLFFFKKNCRKLDILVFCDILLTVRTIKENNMEV